jgi:hypothetical protein
VHERSTERGAVLNPIDTPTSLTSCREELIPGQPHIPCVGLGEEIQILRRARGQPVRQQRRSPGQQEPAAGRQAEEQVGDLRSGTQ